MTVGNKHIAVRRGHDVRQSVKCIRTIACHAGFAESEQDFSFRIEFEKLIAFAVHASAVGCPEVSIAIEMETMRLNEHTAAETFQEISGRIKLEDGRIGPMNHPQVAVRVQLDTADLSPFHTARQLCPVFN